MNLKNILKLLRLNESTISVVLGAMVVLVVGALVVNYFRNLEPKVELPTVSSERKEDVYTVSEGDTLWSIAESEYGDGFKWVEIMKANNLNQTGEIETGQELKIPLVDNQNGIEGDAVSENVVEAGKMYTVKRGDSLWSIATEIYGDGFRWVEIAKINNLSNPDLIHAGNEFLLP